MKSKLLSILLFSLFSALCCSVSRPIYVIEMKPVESSPVVGGLGSYKPQLFINGYRAQCMFCDADENVKIWLVGNRLCVGCSRHPDGHTPVLDKYKNITYKG